MSLERQLVSSQRLVKFGSVFLGRAGQVLGLGCLEPGASGFETVGLRRPAAATDSRKTERAGKQLCSDECYGNYQQRDGGHDPGDQLDKQRRRVAFSHDQ